MKTVIALLKSKLDAMSLDDSTVNSASPLDQQIVEGILKAIPRLDKQDVFSIEEIDELDETSYKKDEFDPVFEDLRGVNETFSYEYICNVLDFHDGPPQKTFRTVVQRYKRVRDESYIRRFRTYRENLGTHR